MKDLIKNLIELQKTDSLILERSFFIEKIPLRISEVDAPLKHAEAELEKAKQKTDVLLKKKRDKELLLEEATEKIRKMKTRVSELKTNKEYQAHLKEIETFETEVGAIEEAILIIMEELDASMKLQTEKEQHLRSEQEKLGAFRKELEEETKEYEKELSLLKEDRSKLIKAIEPDVYDKYMMLLKTGSGVAVTQAKDELCTGCNMNIPPQLFVEITKNEEVIQCPQCLRILYYDGAQDNPVD